MKTTKTKWFASVSLTKLGLLATGMFLAATSSTLATVRYVNVNNANPTPPYTNWATAATDIQDAVDAAGAGDEIVVTNGTYASGSWVDPYGNLNCVVVDTPLTLQSVNGPDVTVINGGGAVRCLYLTNDAVMVGFTLTNGFTHGFGGGVYCESNAVLTNCVLTGNGVYIGAGGGANGGTLNNCTLTGNGARAGECEDCVANGGGAVGCTLNNCTLTGNSTGGGGGGAIDCTLNNCTLTGNSAGEGGGAFLCTLNNCTLTGNSAEYGGGADSSTLNNCVVSANTGGGVAYSTLNNCTVTGNSGWGASSAILNNCIVYFNSDPNGGNYDPSSTLNYCCTTPMPTNGVGNISADPQLASASHLSALSPCIGAGSAKYASGTDIDGEAWANPPSIGCDEYHAGAVTGPLTVSLTATYTNVAPGFSVGLMAFIVGRTDLSVWDFGDGDVEVNEPYTSHAWTAPGDYLVALWAFNDSYPEGVSATVTVHVVEGVYYVAASSGNPVVPYVSWATAATNIQAAVNVAPPGATIFVTNGVYAGGSQLDPYGDSDCVVVETPLTLQSVNGPEVTIIDGGGLVRCLYLTNHAVLVGFTLTNGLTYDSGGGVYCESSSAVLTNCVLSGNSAQWDGEPGDWGYGGGAYGGTLNNCTLTGNSATEFDSGGGAYGCTLNNCTLTGNSANYGGGAADCTLNNCALMGNGVNVYGYFIIGGFGGGAYGSTLNNCTLTGNSANHGGGGACDSALNNCTLTSNSAYGFFSTTYEEYIGGFGGGAYSDGSQPCMLNKCTLTDNAANYGGGAADCTLNNCTLTGNSVNGYDIYGDYFPGFGGGAYSDGSQPCTLNNCTLTGNSASDDGGGAYSCTLNNSIVYFNSDTNGGNYDPSSTLNYCCTTPQPSGIGNITYAPLFVDYTDGNLRLQSNSPCINSGNNAYVVGSTDLDGNPRIVGGTVDIGAYEYQTPVSMISYAWLQQYGLPINTNTDTADLDGTGMNLYQDWVAGLNPTNALSVLKMLSPAITNNPLGLVVSWQSVSNITYFLQSSTNLGAQPAFSTIQSNIVGQEGTTSYTDTTATNAGPYFYRVGVQ